MGFQTSHAVQRHAAHFAGDYASAVLLSQAVEAADFVVTLKLTVHLDGRNRQVGNELATYGVH